MNIKFEQWIDTQLGKDIWEKKYRFENETFEEWLDRISNGNQELKQLILEKKFLFGGRILANRNLYKKGKKITYSNCYVITPPEDNLESIFDTAKKLARTYSYGGGCGVDISKLAPKGAKINNAAKETSGAISFMDLYNLTTELIGQAGRRGALMISISDKHPDLLEFIDIKTNLDKVTKANISIRITDDFMKAIINDEDWTLEYIRPESGETIKKTLKAKEIYKKIIVNNWDYAEPGALYWDRIKNWTLLSEDSEFEFAGTNPCIPLGEYVLTPEGFKKIEDVRNKIILQGKEYHASDMFKTGHKEVFEVELENGIVVKMTDNHKILTPEGDKELRELTIGSKVVMDYTPIYDYQINNKDEYEKGINAGLLLKEENIITSNYDKIITNITDETKEFKLGFLKALFNHTATLYSINKDFLSMVQRLLIEFGIYSNLVKDNKSTIYKLEINDIEFKNIDNLIEYKNISLKNKEDYKREQKIKNIRSIGYMDVYDINVDIVHHFNLNGIIVHNCAEEPLPAGGSCLLGSINLSEFVKNPFTKNAYFDFEEFKKAVEISVKALNEVLLEGLPLHPLQEQRDSVHNWRQMGLGVMGIADMLIKLGIRYGSDEAIEICDKIGFIMADTAIATSARIAAKQGTYPKYKKEAIFKSEYFLTNTTEETRKLVEKYGLAHSQLLTIAPTGSLSTMLGISGGIEPIFNISYTRKTESLHGKEVYYKVYTPIVQQYMEINNITKEEDLPDFFVTAMTLNWKERIDMQAIWQQHIDASISSTVNIPEHITVEEVEDLYIYAWKKGLKGATIYRDNCKRSGILLNTTTNINNKEDKSLQRGDWEPLPEDIIYYKRKIYIGCGKLNLFIGYSPSKEKICDMYVVRSGQGGCEKNLQGMVIAMSGMLRLGGDLHNIEKAFEGMGACNSFVAQRVKGQKLSAGSSCGNAILNEIKSFMNEIKKEQSIPSLIMPKKENENNDFLSKEEREFLNKYGEISFSLRYKKCPFCGTELAQQEGCMTCQNCGWTKCS